MNINLDELRLASANRQKKGLHFILASIIIWIAVMLIHMTSVGILTKNFLTFCFTAPLLPIAYLLSKLIKVDFTNNDNPLTNLGVLFSANQLLYLLIAMWIYNAVPEKMVMILAMIFGAHLLPYGWLYKSTTYMALAVIIPVSTLVLGINYAPFVVAGFMVVVEIIFSVLLVYEIKKMPVVKIAG